MPQLDRIIVFTQIFWLFFIFTMSYVILIHFFLPTFLKSIKSRQFVIETNLHESKNIQNSFLQNQGTLTQILSEGLKIIKCFYSGKFLFKNTKYSISLFSTDSRLVSVMRDMLLYCDQKVLSSIYLNSRTFNFFCAVNI